MRDKCKDVWIAYASVEEPWTVNGMTLSEFNLVYSPPFPPSPLLPILQTLLGHRRTVQSQEYVWTGYIFALAVMPSVGLVANATIVFNSLDGVVQASGSVVEHASFGQIDLNVQYNSKAVCGSSVRPLESYGAFHSNFSDQNVQVNLSTPPLIFYIKNR